MPAAPPVAAPETLDTPRFGRVVIRPVRADDAALIAAGVARQAPEDLRLRFFGMIDELPPDMLAHITRFVPEEEFTFVAAAPYGALLGGVRLVRGPTQDEAEFAVSIASHAKGAGLGRALLAHAIRYARAIGLARLRGDILRENAPMLALARRLGFALAPLAESPEIVRATLALR
jgi:acetyltransferase